MEEEEEIWDEEEEIQETKMTSLTRLSEDEEELEEGPEEEESLSEDSVRPDEGRNEGSNEEENTGEMIQHEHEEKIDEKTEHNPQHEHQVKSQTKSSVDSKPASSELLVLGADGKLRKAKPAVSLIDLFKQATEKRAQNQTNSQPKEETLFDKEDTSGDETHSDETPKEDESSPEDENEYTEQPTAEDYARYREMMKEPTLTHNDLLDSEAEESGDEIEFDGEMEEKEDGKIVVPNGIDIVERAVTEKERRDLLSLHHRMKEQEDDEQLAYVKKGILEGPAYIRRRR